MYWRLPRDHPTESAELSPPSPQSIRHQPEQILASSPFATATRAKRFLKYIVEETLAGQTEGIKELVLGIEAFDRPGDFDPRVDTIVRVEAGKLRKRLQEYYQNEGSTALVRIEVPKGSYVPQFHVRDAAQAPRCHTPDEVRRAGSAGGLREWFLSTRFQSSPTYSSRTAPRIRGRNCESVCLAARRPAQR